METIQYGIGPVGARIARLGLERGMRFVGAVDKDPAKVGKDFGEVLGLDKKLGVVVTDDPAGLLVKAGKKVVIHATGSGLEAVVPQFIELLKAGCTVVSTCEELSYPYYKCADLAGRLDMAAREGGGRLLGTGVNPGFVMDILPLFFSTASQRVTAVKVERRVDASKRREPLQKKIGVGESPEEFENGVRAGRIKHVGLPESIAMIADGLGWKLDQIEESIDPVVSPSLLSGGYVSVSPGAVAGIHQIARGYSGGAEVITLDLKMMVEGEDFDRIELGGSPTLSMEIQGGLNGDQVTASVVINTISGLMSMEPGFYTMLDLVKPRFLSLA